MSESLVPSHFLFRFAVPCRYHNSPWGKEIGVLDESYRLLVPGELDRESSGVELRAAWNEQGLIFTALVSGKRQPPWCRDSRPEDSDAVRLWIDTRDTHDIHRASRFCHQLVCLPSGSGRTLDDPVILQLLIHRSREIPNPIPPSALKIRKQKRPDGYVLDIGIGGRALTGFDPLEYPRLGFNWALVDRELGERIGYGDPTLPYREDPSLWFTLDLVR